MRNVQLTLSVLDDLFSVCRLAPDAGIPHWVPTEGFISVTRTADELSIVCQSDSVPETVWAERDFRVLKIEGPLDFSLTGILLAVAGPLAEAGISIFAVSTYDTDYVLVKKNDLKKAVSVLQLSGHTVG
ncbi:MAG: ACT domain-containing protein [Desulfosarcina sp.]|nr:ACT domain-containing protein [Desulfosarcina sp.]MBC2745328.1 ACT domain-containing protein [Desulfosarcina sp.]MBC2768233.1 ACT domain-containing protein [Desulfosarcina sp.]